MHKLREQWFAAAATLVEEVLSDTHEFDAVQRLGAAFPLRVFPDAVGLPDQGREHLLPYGDFAFNKILMFLGAANRDPRRWTDPDRFDATRNPSGHVGFGMGIHQCVGQHVARLEAEALFTALAARVDGFELTGPAVIRPNNTMRAWQ